MTKEQFRQLAAGRFLFLDGATGSNLMQSGMPAGISTELWILEHAEVLASLQKAYVEAGSSIVYAPTFSANRIKLSEFGLEDRVRELNLSLVEITRKAVGDRALVAGDLTMTGQQLAPIGRMDFEELVDIYKEQIGCLAEAGVDLLVVETMMSLQESRAALIAARETCPDLPVMVTMTFENDGRSLFGTDAVTAAVVLESLGADAIGANCSTGPEKMAEVIRQMAQVVQIPLIAKPNAGLPKLDETGRTVYDMTPEEFGSRARLLAEAGASVLGGCCGTTPAHIAALVGAVGGQRPRERKPVTKSYLTSERMTVGFGPEDPFLVVGERINPTGKKKLQAELKEGSLETVLRFAEEQQELGASILDVNMGMSGIDEKAMMLRALEEIAGVTNLPLSVDSSHIAVMEAALRRYPGRALINSISMETAKMEPLLQLAKKYGAMFILLPLSDAGLPKNQEEKISIIETVSARAHELGLSQRDIVVDGLVTTVGANQTAALEALDTIRYCKKNGFSTTCGLSNISFGLPERGSVNAAFLTMAIQEGLTMAIANPSQELLMSAAFASDLLLAKEGSGERYIRYAAEKKQRSEAQQAASGKEKAAELSGQQCRQAPDKDSAASGTKQEDRPGIQPVAAAGQEKEETPEPAAQKVYTAVLKGSRKTIETLTRQALEAQVSAPDLLNRYLMPAINEVGALFDSGRYFLPQLIASAEAMKLSITILEPLLQKEQGDGKMPVVVIATVAGDIHDIGKNLVALMFKNYGFTVIDLGKDVPKEQIVEAALAHGAQIIALSALMTTTMQEMRHVIAYARQQGVSARIIIGGAVVTQEYADEIGADGYSKDAADAVRLAKRLLEEKDGQKTVG